jgi:hypothetical protein
LLLTAAESKLAEARNQYDQMVEYKQLELSKHLKEISQRNDQVLHIKEILGTNHRCLMYCAICSHNIYLNRLLMTLKGSMN